jgi:DNA-binding transcriptional LysR family regulator
MDRLTTMTTFTAVVTSGSFAEAARQLNLSPALVSKHVQSLEDRLGARLLHRTTRKISLTEAGQGYFDKASQILAEIEAADTSIGNLQSKPCGTLRVNASNLISDHLVALFTSFAAVFPEITLDFVTTDRMPDLVEEGIDVAIRANPELESRVIARPLVCYRVICCAAPSYIARHGTPRVIEDLARHNCLCFMYPGFTMLTREWHLTAPRDEITVPVSGNLHTNSTELLHAAVLDGRGIGMVPSYRAVDDISAGRLVHLFPEYRSAEISIVALYPNRQHLPMKVRSFVDFAVKHFARLGSPSDRETSASIGRIQQAQKDATAPQSC